MAFQNLSILINNVANATGVQAVNMAASTISNLISGNNRGDLRFVYRNKKAGWLRILVNSAFPMITAAAANAAKEYTQNLLRDKKKEAWLRRVEARQESYNSKVEEMWKENLDRQSKYSTLDGVTAYDMYKKECYDALLLGIAKNVDDKSRLVWYDCTAIITFNTTRNVVLTQVVGRDYTRKELISNGDIEITVNGHILSDTAEIAPVSELKKFIEVMNYKGALKVNNYLLDQYNIKQILVKNYSLTPVEGTKNRIDYSFSAVGIQPKNEVKYTGNDTLSLLDIAIEKEVNYTHDNNWIQFLKQRATQISGQAADKSANVLNNYVADLW